MPRYKLPLVARFPTKYRMLENGCWEWTGAQRTDGYGIVRVDGKCDGAHRYSYIIYKGPIPKGMVVRHTCDYHLCVNPEHLILGTQAQNLKDARDRGRKPTAKCPSVSMYYKGCRCEECIECFRASNRFHYHKNKKINGNINI